MQKVRKQSGGDRRRKTTTDAWNVTDRQTDRQLSDPEPPGPLLHAARAPPQDKTAAKGQGRGQAERHPRGLPPPEHMSGRGGGGGGWSTC